MEIKRSNPKAFETIGLRLKELANVQGKVGWFETSKYEDGTPVAYVAAIQELGYGPIPPRPFMRPTAKKEKNSWREKAKMLALRVVEGKMSADDAMSALTIQAEGDVSNTIAEITSPPLSPLTIAARKYRQQGKKVTGATLGELSRKLKDGTIDLSGVSTKPLNDTGLMIATLTHVVENTK